MSTKDTKGHEEEKGVCISFVIFVSFVDQIDFFSVTSVLSVVKKD